jgi:hypothetical protein
MKPHHAGALGAVLGLAVALVCEAVYYSYPRSVGSLLLILIGPSSIQLILLEFRQPALIFCCMRDSVGLAGSLRHSTTERRYGRIY